MKGAVGGGSFCISNPTAYSSHRTHSFDYSSSRYLLSTHHAPGIALALQTVVNKKKGPSPKGADIPGGRERMNR